MTDEKALAALIKPQLSRRGLTVSALAERTKVPRSTIRWLLGEDVVAVLPGRIYLRGQTRALAKELGLSEADVMAAFDASFPVPDAYDPDPTEPLRRRAALIGASLGCAALVMVVIAFASAF
ncbi:MAG: helix-turn-helix domain-containing protein [Myxococcota bacterium]